MNKLQTFITAFIFFTSPLYSQKIITLKECYDFAIASDAISGEKKSYAEISKLKDKNLLKGWYPTIDANGSFVYNSSVVDIGSALSALPFPGIASAIKPLPNEQYKITLDLNQTIYDGGLIKKSRALEKADLNVNEQQTETDLYKLREQVNSVYFNLLLTDRQRDLLKTYLALIKERIATAQSGVNNGMILKSDVDVLTSQKISIDQQLSENSIRKMSLLKILSDLTGTPIDTASRFILPELTKGLPTELTRPELTLFDLKKNQLSASGKLIDTRRMPKAFGFATFGYGNPPGSNFFKNEFAPYYILGAGFKWNIIDWSKSKNEKQVIALQQNILEGRKTDLSDNLKRQLETKKSEILSIQTLIDSDNELIALRKRISISAESQYNNGTITATEYLNQLNAEQQAIINSEIHKINLSLAKVQYLNISGQEIE